MAVSLKTQPEAVVDEKPACTVCFRSFESEGEDNGDEALAVMATVRCVHKLCIECFADLEHNKSYNCPTCRRPIIARYNKSYGRLAWFTVADTHVGTMAGMVNQGIFESLRKAFPHRDVLWCQEVSDVLHGEFSERFKMAADNTARKDHDFQGFEVLNGVITTRREEKEYSQYMSFFDGAGIDAIELLSRRAAVDGSRDDFITKDEKASLQRLIASKLLGLRARFLFISFPDAIRRSDFDPVSHLRESARRDNTQQFFIEQLRVLLLLSLDHSE